MKTLYLSGIFVAGALASGCQDRAADPETGRHGRFLGVGTYSAGELWSKMAQSGKQGDPAAATLLDDEHIIVVVDSQTGEVRECGDYSGYCVSMNPWTKAIAPEQAAPVKLTKHAADLADEAEEAERSRRH